MQTLSPTFIAAIKSPVHTIAIRMTVLDTSGNPVPGGVFHDVSYTADSTGIMTDGSVDLDITRGARRTFTASLLNDNGEWAPQADWSGLFYVNRMIRLERGIQISENTYEYVTIGTFYIDTADIAIEKNMSMIALAGTDGWKKLATSRFGYAKTYAKNTNVNVILKDLASFAGITKLALDDLNTRTTAAKQLSVALAVERDHEFGDIVSNLATTFGIYIYFDPFGRMVSSEVPQPGTTQPCWVYDPSDNNNLLTVKASYKDDLFFNAVLVYGTGNKNHPVVSNRADTDPRSPTNVNAIGRRTDYYETDTISTQAQADACANKRYTDNMAVTEDIQLETICNPAFEGGDIITVREPSFSNLNSNYIVRQLSIPLSSSRMTIKLERTRNVY